MGDLTCFSLKYEEAGPGTVYTPNQLVNNIVTMVWFLLFSCFDSNDRQHFLIHMAIFGILGTSG